MPVGEQFGFVKGQRTGFVQFESAPTLLARFVFEALFADVRGILFVPTRVCARNFRRRGSSTPRRRRIYRRDAHTLGKR